MAAAVSRRPGAGQPETIPHPLTVLGAPSLLKIATAALLHWKSNLGDIGHTPAELLASIFEACTPPELADIEDATRSGIATRDLSHCTWFLWRRHCASGQLATLGALPAHPPPLPARSGEATAGVAPAHYRSASERAAVLLVSRTQLKLLPRCAAGWCTSSACEI